MTFEFKNFIYLSDIADDPCESNSCSIYAECVSDEDAPENYTCICKVGFEGDGFSCYDVNECVIGENDCHMEAECYNLVGHYECKCRSPYRGNGKECSLELSCSQCDQNAHCVEADFQKRCICVDGYEGNGFKCSPTIKECECGINAECLTNHLTNKKECKCKYGFVGDGHVCQPSPCNEFSNCHENAKCILRSRGIYECECIAGFSGDGYQCSTQGCDLVNNCGENAVCIPDSFTLQYRCVCAAGYAGNGFQCFKDSKLMNLFLRYQ